jgi:hypothetical protein
MSVETQIAAQIDELTAILMSKDPEQASCALKPRPKRVIDLYPGDVVAWDDCCSGQLSFRLVSMTPNFANPAGRTSLRGPCAVKWWDIVIEVKILRCTPTVGSNNVAPRAEKISESGLEVVRDMQTVLNAIKKGSAIYDLGVWNPAGPQGGCVGGSWEFTMRADADPC